MDSMGLVMTEKGRDVKQTQRIPTLKKGTDVSLFK